LTPITLPSLLALGPSPSASEKQKRSRANLDVEGKGELEDTNASGNGTIPAKITTGSVHPNSTRQESPPKEAKLTREDVVTAFLASPLLPDLDKLRVDHISALMALSVDGDTQKASIRLLAPKQSHTMAEKVWAA
jgi:hypothetical protein